MNKMDMIEVERMMNIKEYNDAVHSKYEPISLMRNPYRISKHFLDVAEPHNTDIFNGIYGIDAKRILQPCGYCFGYNYEVKSRTKITQWYFCNECKKWFSIPLIFLDGN